MKPAHVGDAIYRPRFTLLELLMVIAIIAVLASMLLPGLHRARMTARTSNCLSNMKNIGMAIIQYGDDNIEHFPLGNDAAGNNRWHENLAGYTYTPKLYYCQEDSQNGILNWQTDKERISYGYNLLGLGFVDSGAGKPHPIANNGTTTKRYHGQLPAVRDPPATLVLVDAGIEADAGRGYYLGSPDTSLWPGDFIVWRRHFRSTNVLFAEGHVEGVPTTQLTTPDQTGNAAAINNYRLWSPIR